MLSGAAARIAKALGRESVVPIFLECVGVRSVQNLEEKFTTISTFSFELSYIHETATFQSEPF